MGFPGQRDPGGQRVSPPPTTTHTKTHIPPPPPNMTVGSATIFSSVHCRRSSARQLEPGVGFQCAPGAPWLLRALNCGVGAAAAFFQPPPPFFSSTQPPLALQHPPPPLYPSFFFFVHLRVNASRPLRIQQVTQRGDHVTSLFLRDPPIMNQEYQGGPRAGGGGQEKFVCNFSEEKWPQKI